MAREETSTLSGQTRFSTGRRFNEAADTDGVTPWTDAAEVGGAGVFAWLFTKA